MLWMPALVSHVNYATRMVAAETEDGCGFAVFKLLSGRIREGDTVEWPSRPEPTGTMTIRNVTSRTKLDVCFERYNIEADEMRPLLGL